MAESKSTVAQPHGSPVTPDAEARRLSARKEKAGIPSGAPGETKASKFRRLALKRVNRAIKTIGYVRNLANRSVYDYTDEQRQAVLRALDESVAAVHDAFAHRAPQKKEWTL